MVDSSGSLYACVGACWESCRGLVGRVASCCAAVCLLMPVMSAHADDIAYRYDALGRLTSVTVTGATAYYDYDAAGNITGIRREGAVSSVANAHHADGSPHSGAGALPDSVASAQAATR